MKRSLSTYYVSVTDFCMMDTVIKVDKGPQFIELIL